jgi:hypothetical protein
VRRCLAILLLAFLPLQFSWAAVAFYCEHAGHGAGHAGHHDHAHHGSTSGDAGPAANLSAAPLPTPDEAPAAQDDQASGAAEAGCGHCCHGTCGAMLIGPLGMPGVISTAPPRASLDEAGMADAPTRPERPQWPPLA